MPDFGRPDFGKPAEPSLDEIRRSDSFIDALAGGRPVAPHDAADAELAALLGGWRDETRWPPATGLITESDAIAALNAGRAARRSGSGRDRWDPDAATTPRRRPRGLSVIGATAAAVLCIGGFGAVVAGAGPGDGLYGVRTMLFGTPKQVRDDQVGLAARTQLNQVQDLISRGDWQQAQDKLVEVSTQVASIGDQQQKQDLLEQFNDLSAKVVERDPAATAPPGVVYTVPPSSAQLVPAVAPTSTPSAPPVSPSTTPTTSTAPATSAAPVTSATPTSPTPSGPGTTTETPASGTAPTTSVTDSVSSVPPSSVSSPATSSAAPSAQSEPTTTPTSAAPTTTVTAAPSAAEATTSAAPAPTAAVTTTAAVERSASPTGESSPAAPAESPAGSAPAPVPESVVTTTVVIPVPIG
jgi:hypothetical protein